MERLLRDAMSRDHLVDAESPACLDVEMLAAWADGTLDRADRARGEAHAAGCARCQAMLAAMIRTADAQAPSVGAGRPISIKRWLMMLAPALAGAAAVILYLSIEPGQRDAATVGNRAASTSAPERDANAAPPPAATPPAQPSAPAEASRLADKSLNDRSPASEFRAGGSPVSKDAQGNVVPQKPVSSVSEDELRRRQATPADAKAKVDADSRSAREGAAGELAKSVGKEEEEKRRAESGGLAERVVVTTPPATAAATSSQTLDQEARLRADAAASGQRQQAQAPPPSPMQNAQNAQNAPDAITRTAPVNAPKPAGVAGAAAAQSKVNEFGFDSKSLGAIDVASPTPAIRWRVRVGSTAIERSADGGATWTTQFTPAGSAVFTAGVSPSSAVCWLVGRGGLVFVSRDGLTWQRIAFPESADLKAVSASDDRNATVVTADNRTFVTADGGQSWQVRKN